MATSNIRVTDVIGQCHLSLHSSILGAFLTFSVLTLVSCKCIHLALLNRLQSHPEKY